MVAGLLAALVPPALAASADEAAAPAGTGSPAPSATAGSPSGTASSSPSAGAPSSAQPSGSTAPTDASPTPAPDTPSADPTPDTVSPGPTQPGQPPAGDSLPQAAPDPAITLSVKAGGTPQAGRFFEDIGYFAIRGTTAEGKSGRLVEVYRYDRGSKSWRRTAQLTTGDGGRYGDNQPVKQAESNLTFITTLGGVPGTNGVRSSNPVAVDVANSYVVLSQPKRSVDSLSRPTLKGYVRPARRGVTVNLGVRRSGRWSTTMRVVTRSDGSFSGTWSYGRGRLATYRLRASYPAANRDRWETSTNRLLTRAAVLNAKVTRTTAAEVSKTYRAGCPVGPSRLRTITMNFYGRDRRMHRGLVIIRSDLTTEVIRGFSTALRNRFPIAKMKNPNAYGGNDPRQMEANNTSGFNCRKVVGNPYAQSPHSYGIAIDVTPVQNPYRDVSGRWWPSNGRSYIDRTPLRFGMLGSGSSLTRQLGADGFFWGGYWSPGRDYQHFQYR